MKELRDNHGRHLDHLRLSVTDRCNLRCQYCMPAEGLPLGARAEILTWEESYRICQVFAGLGVRSIRVTGGEPMVRTGVFPFLRRLGDLPGRPEILMTTNGMLLARSLHELRTTPVTRLNVSLDTLSPARFRRIARRDGFESVWRGLTAAADAGFAIKINVVVLPGENESEIPDFVSLTHKHDWTVRFIEPMPFDGAGGNFGGSIDGASILARIRDVFPVERVQGDGDGVAVLYQVPGFRGRVGIIHGYSRSFCATCSRIRVSASGELRTCLYGKPVADLRSIMRAGGTDKDLVQAVVNAAMTRFPDGHAAERANQLRGTAQSMATIGG